MAMWRGKVPIPFYWNTNFYQTAEQPAQQSSERCQSPIYRDSHFYVVIILFIIAFLYRVNPLSIGTPISTDERCYLLFCGFMCQSPIHRDTHFYPHPKIA